MSAFLFHRWRHRGLERVSGVLEVTPRLWWRQKVCLAFPKPRIFPRPYTSSNPKLGNGSLFSDLPYCQTLDTGWFTHIKCLNSSLICRAFCSLGSLLDSYFVPVWEMPCCEWITYSHLMYTCAFNAKEKLLISHDLDWAPPSTLPVLLHSSPSAWVSSEGTLQKAAESLARQDVMGKLYFGYTLGESKILFYVCTLKSLGFDLSYSTCHLLIGFWVSCRMRSLSLYYECYVARNWVFPVWVLPPLPSPSAHAQCFCRGM